MSIEENKHLARRLYELLNEHDIEAIGDLVATDYVENNPLPGQGTGREGVIDRFSMIDTGLASRYTVEDVVAEGDRVAVRWSSTGTHVGEFAGIPATGKPFAITGMDFYRIEDGVLCEHWDVVDQLALLGQLGVIPAMSG